MLTPSQAGIRHGSRGGPAGLALVILCVSPLARRSRSTSKLTREPGSPLTSVLMVGLLSSTCWARSGRSPNGRNREAHYLRGPRYLGRR